MSIKNITPLPSVTKWLFSFQSFNAMNFTLALAAPMVLSARYIGANEAQIGWLTSLMPLMVLLQLVGTKLVGWFGCRRVMMWGWGLRSCALFFIMPLPLLVGRVETTVLVGVMLFGMFLFTFIRGFASVAWFPWLAQLIPEGQRGQYFGKEQRFINIAAFLTLIVFASFLGDEPAAWQYTLIWVFSWGAGCASVYMLSRVPESGIGKIDVAVRNVKQEYWETFKRIWSHKPFRRATIYTAIFFFALMAQPGFLVLYVKDELGFGEGAILYFQAAANFGVLLSSVFWGKLSDLYGSRPLLRICDLGVFLTFAFWIGGAFGFYHFPVQLIYFVYFAGGVFMSAHGVAQCRLLLGCCPEKDQTMAMALFAVINALCGGSAPILAGYFLTWLRQGEGATSGGVSISYAILFSTFLFFGLLSQLLLFRVPEPKSKSAHHVLLWVVYGWPMRILSGFISGNGKRPG
jgi:MFS family permease